MNRYNHTLKKEVPDATFNNKLDRINPGLKKAFENTYGLNLSKLPKGKIISNYVLANDGKYYKYNYEINNIYYCPNNIIIDNYEVKAYDKSKYIVLDNFIIDLVNKEIKLYDKNLNDSFTDGLSNIDKIEVTVDKTTKDRTITINNDIVIVLDKLNRITSYKNNSIKIIEDDFLNINRTLTNIELNNVVYIGNNFLYNNSALRSISFPNLKQIGDSFIYNNSTIEEVNLPKVEIIGNKFMVKNLFLPKLYLPNIIDIGDHALEENRVLYEIDISNAKNLGNNLLLNNEKLRSLDISNAISVGNNLLINNMIIEEVKANNLKYMGEYCFMSNRGIRQEIRNKIEMTNNHLR